MATDMFEWFRAIIVNFGQKSKMLGNNKIFKELFFVHFPKLPNVLIQIMLLYNFVPYKIVLF